MADLTGIQIKNLQQAPSLLKTTEMVVQRVGASKAEKTNLGELNNFFINSTELNNYISSNITSNSSSTIANHLTALDPHGDRAQATLYTNSVMDSHENENDPHGDRLFSSNLITTSIANHKNAVDPHGDRAFATTTATSLLDAHVQQADPHGSKTFTTTSINTAINSHKTATDPHGDRAYADTISTSKVDSHVSDTDPHGDRAFATSGDTTTLQAAKAYSDNSFTSKIGTSIAPLTDGKIPTTFLKENIELKPLNNFPLIGDASKLYIDTVANSLYYWGLSGYTSLSPTFDLGEANLTTDLVPEGTNINRKYLTDALKTKVNNSIQDIVTDSRNNLGYPILDNTTNKITTLKKIRVSEPLTLSDVEGCLVIADNSVKYTVKSSLKNPVLVPASENLGVSLETFNPSLFYNIKGKAYAYTTQTTSGSTLVNLYNSWDIDIQATTLGVTEKVPSVITASINSTGTTLSGTALPSSIVEVYDQKYTLVKTINVNTLGNFTTTLSPAKIDGSLFYLYVQTVANERSEKFTVYAPNTTALKLISNISVSPDGFKVRGIGERLSTVTIKNTLDEVLGTATTNSNGYFEIVLTTKVELTTTISIAIENNLGTTNSISYTVEYTTTVTPYNIRIDSERKSIVGKAEPESLVSLLSASEEVIQTFLTDSLGDFSGNIISDITTQNTFKIKGTIESVDSSITTIELPIFFIKNTPPAVIDVLVDSTFDFLSKKIVKQTANSNFNFDITVDDTSFQLLPENNTTSIVKWVLDLKITTEDITI